MEPSHKEQEKQAEEFLIIQNPQSNEKEKAHILGNISEKIMALFFKTETGDLEFDESWQCPFKQHLTESNNCVRVFKTNQQFYTCSNCCYNESYTIMCFCQECWIPERHEGHHFTKRTASSIGEAFCDCGRAQRIKKQSFCDRHGDKKIEIQINKEDQDEFVNYFFQLFKVVFNCEKKFQKLHDSILEKVTNSLIELTTQSAYYCRMVIELLRQEVDMSENGKEKWSLFQAISYKRYCSKLFFNLVSDEVSKLQMTKWYVTLENNGLSNRLRGLSQIKDELFLGRQIIQKLTEENIFIQKQPKRYIQFAKAYRNYEVLIKFIKFIYYKEEKKNSFIKIVSLFFNGEDQILSSQQFSYFLIDKLFQWIENKEIQQNQVKTAKVLFFMSKILSNLSHCKIENMNPSYFLHKFNIKTETINNFIKEFMKNGREIFFGEKIEKSLQISLIFPFFLAVDSEYKTQYIDHFWQSFSRENSKALIEMIDISYQLLAFISHLDMIHILNLPFEKKINKQTEEVWDHFFRSYLYFNKNIPQEEIWDMILKKQMQYSMAVKTLNELCTFNYDTSTFNYTSQKEYPNSFMIFNYKHKIGNVVKIKSTKLDFNSIIQLENRLQIKLLSLIFNCQQFFPRIKKQWKNSFTNQNLRTLSRLKSLQLGYLYLIIVLAVYKLIGENNQLLVEQIDLIAKDPNYRSQYSLLAQSNSVQKLFCLKNEQNIEKTEEQIIETDKKKSELKKKLMIEKLKKKGNLILQKNDEKVIHLEDQEQCLLCHETNKQIHPLVYFSQVTREQTLSASIYGKNSKANVLFETCFHAVHFDCLIKTNRMKNNLQFSCLFCQRKGNCILPFFYDPKEKKLISICENIINASSIVNFKVYQPENMFILLFKHFLSSKSLNSLISLPRYVKTKNQRSRVDNHILKLLTEIYCRASERQTIIYEDSIQMLLDEVNKCDKIFAQIQTLFIEAIHLRIRQEASSVNFILLKQISNQLCKEEFEVIKCGIEQLIGQEIELEAQDVNPQALSLSFKIIRLPSSQAQLSNSFKKNCSYCKSAFKYHLCLLCGAQICRQCSNSKNHRDDAHNGNWLFFSFESAKVTIDTKKVNQTFHVYLNQLMMPYELQNTFFNSVFKLNEIKLRKVTDKFVESL